MTAAVGSAGGGGTEGLLQTVAGKASGSGHRGLATLTGETKSEPEETSQSPSRGEIDASDAQVDKAAKTAKHKNGKSKAGGDDGLFQETFDNIGQDESKESAAKSGNATAYLPDLSLMRMAANATMPTQSDTTGVPLETQQTAVRPAALLQQKSILALLDTKDRLSLSGGETTSDSANAADVGTATTDPFGAQSDGATEAVPITIDRRETHWNFRNDALMSAASQVSSSQFAARNFPPSAALQKSAPAGAVKEQPVDTKASNGAEQNLASPQAVAMPDADQSTNSAFTNSGSGDQKDAELQKQAAPASDRTAGKVESTSSLDQIFSPDALPQQSPSNATTQVRNGVLDSLAANSANAGTTTADLPNRSSPTPVLRTLDLTLSPPDLGSVKLRLSLKDNSLSIEAEASKSATAKLLNDDRPNLERGLKDAGYDISSVKITDISASSSSNSSGWQANGSPSRDGDSARSGFAGNQDGEMQRRDGSPSDQAQRRPKDDNPKMAQAEVVAGRLGNAVYI